MPWPFGPADTHADAADLNRHERRRLKWRNRRMQAPARPAAAATPVLFESYEPRLLLSGAPMGTVLAGSTGPAIFQDADGTTVTATLQGPGQWQFVQGAVLPELTVTGTDATSTFSIATAGGDGRLALEGVTLAGPLDSFTAQTTDPAAFFSLSGAVQTIVLGNVRDMVLSAPASIGSIAVESWQGSGAANRIDAPSVGVLSSAGQLNLDINLSGTGLALGEVKAGGALSGGTWQVAGDVGTLNARAVGSTWTGDFAGGTGVVQTIASFAGTLATPSLQVLAVGGGLLGAQVRVGANFGADGRPGGSAADADEFSAGFLGQLRVAGSMIGARVHVGVDPGNGIYDDGDDSIVGGAASRIQSVVVGGRMDSASRIVAGALPATLRIGGRDVAPASSPGRFAVAADDNARPVLSVALANDTGVSGSDRVTAEPAMVGAASDAGGIAELLGRLDATGSEAFTDLTDLLAPDGSFALSDEVMDTLAGGTLADGPHVLQLVAVDRSGNARGTRIAFTLSDTQISAALVNDTGSSASDGYTREYAFSGQVVAGGGVAALTAALDGGAAAAVAAAADGTFSLSQTQIDTLAGGALAEGAHTLRLGATDTNGIATSLEVAFTYDVTAPVLTQFGLTASSDTGTVGDNTTAAGRVGLVGITEAGASATLGGAVALAAGNGGFQFADVVLADGDNTLSVTVADRAGNTATDSITISRAGTIGTDAAIAWNQATLEAVRKTSVYPEIATRVMAMVGLAQFDTLAAIEGTAAFLVKQTVAGPVDTELALAKAAHTVLYGSFPGQRADFDAILATATAAVADGAAKTNALALGAAVGQAVLDIRASDGADNFVEYNASSDVGRWRPTAPTYQVAEEPQWAELTPFAMTSPDQFQAPPPPALDSAEYAAALAEVQQLGSATSATRTADQAEQAQFWSDGRGSYTPPGHWNAIAQQVAAAQGNSLAANVRLFAQLNVALADAAIAAWNTKFAYSLWRPIDAIQNAGDDANAATIEDAAWAPLLISPPHPEYVSGHSTFSGAAAEVLKAVFGDVAFTTDSYTLPGVTRAFTSFEQAAAEAGRSRIYGGIHFSFSDEGGQAIGAQVAGQALSRFNLAEDTQGPSVVAAIVPVATGSNVALTGQVLDNLSGVARARFSIDGGAAQALVLDAEGRFKIDTAFSLDATQDGLHSITISAEDVAGNAADPVVRNFRLDTLAPSLKLASVAEGDTLGVGTRLTGVADPTGSTLRGLTYAFNGGTAASLTYDGITGSFDSALNINGLDIGNHTLTLTGTDAAGNTATLTRTVTLASLAPFMVTAYSPTAGAINVGSTQLPEVRFSRAVKLDTLTANSFYATAADGTKLAGSIVPAQDGTYAWLFLDEPMPGGALVSVHVDGSLIRAAADGAFLDADMDGAGGGQLVFSFTTVSLTAVAGTTLRGRVVDPGPDLEPMSFDDIGRGADGVMHTADDVFKLPIANAKVYLLGQESRFVYTDADGFFELTDLPAGNVKVAVDGRTATNAPTGVFFPEMVMDATLEPGVENTMMDSMGTPTERAANAGRLEVYLPRVPTTIFSVVSDSVATTVGVDQGAAPSLTDAQRGALTLTVAPGSVIGADGRPITDAQIGMSTVPPELVRDMLPPGVLQHTFDITIQAPGAATFATPATITFPNVFNAAPGTKLNILSFDHTTGMLVINGTATVSEDGLTVVSDEGAGVRAPGWHGITPPGGCNPSGGAPPPPPPPDPTETVTEHPPVALNLMTGSAATDNFPGFSWTAPPQNPDVPPLPPIPGCEVPPRRNSDPQQPFINVTIEIDGPLATFAKPAGGGLPLQSQAFTLSPGTGVTKKFNFDAKSYDEMYGSVQGFADLLRDQLYGAKIKITVLVQKANGDRTRDVHTFYQDRFVTVVDAFQADKQTGDTMAFFRANTDGVVRTNKVDLFLPTSVNTTFEGGGAPFSLAGSFSGTTTLVGKFDPDKAGYDQSSAFKITVSDSKGPLAVGTINTLGTGTAPTTISVDEVGYRAELDRALKAVHLITEAGKDGKFGTADDTTKYNYDYGGGVKNLVLPGKDGKAGTADDVTLTVADKANNLGDIGASFTAEFKGFLPGTAYTAKQYSDMLDGQVAAMKTAVVADYKLAGKQYEVVASNAKADVTMVWGDTFYSGDLVYGFADFDRATPYMEYFLGLRGADGKGSISQAALEYAVAQGLNPNAVNSGQFGVAINFDWTSGASFAQFVANTVSHELAHTFGLNDAYVNIPGKGSPPVNPPNDIMRSGNTGDPDLTFAASNADILKAALGIQGSGDTPLTASVLLYRNNFNLPGSVKGVREGKSDLTTPLLDVAWAGGDLYDGGSLAFGMVGADGAGGTLQTIDLSLTNSGFDTLVFSPVKIGDSLGGKAFSLVGGDLKGVTVAPGANVTVTVAFDPSVVGAASSSLTIDSNAEFGQVTIGLTGAGIAAVPTALASSSNNNFGGMTVGALPVLRNNVFTIANSGVAGLAITDIRLVEGQAEFTLLGVPADLAGNPVSLGLDETMSFGILFSPSHLGLQRAVIEVVTNDPANPILRLGAVGTGITELPTAAWGNDYVSVKVIDPFNPPALHAQSDDKGNFSFFLPSSKDYHLTVFDPATGLVAHDYGKTAPSGRGVDLTASLVFAASMAQDSDFDGLPDDVEAAIGTNPRGGDTDKDGLGDFTEIQQGLDALGGLGLPTGVVSAAALKGTAESVTVTGGVGDARLLTAYVATGSHGLAVVDVSKFSSPVVLAELDLAGENTRVAVDAGRAVALVAAGSGGLHFVDVSTPESPTLIRTEAFAAPVAAVALRDGTAFVAVGADLFMVDVATGDLRQTIGIGGATLRDVVVVNDAVFTLDSGHALRVLSVDGDLVSLRGNVVLPDGGARLTVGNGVAYVAGSSGATGGFLTVDISDLDAPVLISGIDDNSLAGTAVALNGSGRAVVAGGINFVFGGFKGLDLVDVSDPDNTGAFLTRYDLPQIARDVTIANGMAFVADGTAGLQVVNYLGFDTQGIAPTAKISIAAIDADPVTPGVQVLEGRSIHVVPDVADDVQVRNVELLVNGKVVVNDPTFPFDLFTAVPTIAVGGGTMTIQLRATDTGGNSALSEAVKLAVVPDTFAPEVVAVSVAEDAKRFFVRNIEVRFDEPVDTALLGTSGVTLVRVGADGKAGTADDIAVSLKLDTRAQGQVVSAVPLAPLAPGDYQFRIDPAVIADAAGNKLAAPILRHFTIRPASDVKATTGSPEIAQAPSANPGQQIGISVPFDPTTARMTFATVTGSGTVGTVEVQATKVDVGQSTAFFSVPYAAITGDVEVYAQVGDTKTGFDDGKFLLQVVPVVTGVQVTSVGSNGVAQVTLSGLGFIEGNGTEYRFGSEVVVDSAVNAGANVFAQAPDYFENNAASMGVALSDAAFGPITVKTAGGTSAAFAVAISGVEGTALSGTPANAAIASANPGQAVTLVGSGLSTTTDVILRYRDSGSTAAVQTTRLSPVSVTADGSRATLVLPKFVNDVFALQVIGANVQPVLQIVPLLDGFETTGGNLYLYGGGFVEGGSTITLRDGEVIDTAANVLPDIYYHAAADNTGIRLTEPGHGLGSVSVTTAGGTSVSIALNELRTSLGYLRDVAVDTATGDVWVIDNGSPAAFHRLDLATGHALQSFALDNAGFGSTTFYGDLQVVQAPFTLGATNVPAGSLLMFNGQATADRVIAVDPATGLPIASLTLATNYNLTAGVFNAATGSLFVLDRSTGTHRIVEVSAVDGTEIAGFNAPINATDSGLAIDPVTGHLWYGSDQSADLIEVSTTGTVLRSINRLQQGMASSELTGLAFDGAGRLLASSNQGRVFVIDPARDFAQVAPVLSGIVAAADMGTAANAALPAANAGQVIELVGANFGAGTQVLFGTRDNLGQTGTTAVAPLVINGAGTRLQVLVPFLATTGDVRVSNVGARDLGFRTSYADAIYRQVTVSFTADDATTVLRFADGGLEGVSNESWGLDNVKVTLGGTTVFADDFETGVAAAQWSDGRVDTSGAGVFSRFSGRFASEEQRLTLSGLTAGQTYTLSFDLYAIDSLDGEATSSGPDLFQVQADGTLLLRESLSNTVANAQSINNSAGVRLQVVPTLTGMTGRPGSDNTFTLAGSGFMEGASTVTVGGVALLDTFTNLSTLDVYGSSKNSAYAVVAPIAVEGPIRVTTEGGFAEIAGPAPAPVGAVAFSGIAADAGSGTPAQLGQPSANAGQLITLTGRGFDFDTQVEFEGVDDTGTAGTITRFVSRVTAGGTQASVVVPALAASGMVRVLGQDVGYRLQVVPLLRSLGGTVAPGNTVLIEGSGLVQSEVVVQVDGRAIGNFSLRTVVDPSTSRFGDAATQNQQLLSVVLPNGVANPVVTVSTAGGTATLRTGVLVTSTVQAPAADGGDTIATAGVVNVGQGQRVVLNAEIGDGAFKSADVDFYSVTLAQGDVLNVFGAGAIDTYVRVFDADAKSVRTGFFDDAGGSSLQFDPPAAGTYHIGVSNSSNGSYDPAVGGSGYKFGSTGTYQVTLERMADSQSRLSGIQAVAGRGTAAQPGVAAANVGQTITLTGSGLGAESRVVFTTVNTSGLLGTVEVTAQGAADDGTSLTVLVPTNATTGMVRLEHDRAGVLLQVVPTLDAVDVNAGLPFNNGNVVLVGSGFAEGASSIAFGTTVLHDSSRFTGLLVRNAGSPDFRANGRIDTAVPNGVATGPIRVSTVGGTSDTLARSFTAMVAAAQTGTPADAAVASANPGQSVAIAGSGLSLTTSIVFETIDSNGTRGQTTARPWQVNDAGTAAQVQVPDSATTGFVRVVGDQGANALRLQVVPVLDAVEINSIGGSGATLNLRLSGRGFVEGNGSEYRFGDVTVDDGNASTGPDVYSGSFPYTDNGRASLVLPLSDAAIGPLTVRTEGGTSAPLTYQFTAVAGTALSGTPAKGDAASANPGQVVTLAGVGLSTATDVLFSYIDGGGGARSVVVNPSAAAPDGSSAALLVPLMANGVATLRILGSSTQHTLQIVPTVDGFSYSGNTLYLTGTGFVEGASSFTVGGTKVDDVAVGSGPEIYFATKADNTGAYFTQPRHGLGGITVNTAGGTSTVLAMNALQPLQGYLRDVAFDSATGAIWIANNASPASISRLDSNTGEVVQAIVVNTTDFGSTSFYGGMQFVTEAFSLNGTNVPVGSLLVFNGWPNADRVIALNAATGAAIASLTLGANYDMSSGVFDPTSGNLFVIDRRTALHSFVEIDPTTGAEVARFAAPFNAGESGLAIDPVTDNLWYGSDQSNQLVEMSRSGTVLRTLALLLQDVQNTTVSGLAFDATGRLLASATSGRVFVVDTTPDYVQTTPTLTGIVGGAFAGTAANGAVASANVGQVVELVGTNFGPGTQVIFATRDQSGVTGFVVAVPQLTSADGTRLQVVVPSAAATGDVRVTNVPARNLGFSSTPDAIYRQVTLSFTADDASTVLRFADGGLDEVANESWGIDNVRVTSGGGAVVFADDFEGAASPQWSDPRIDDSTSAVFTRFSGRFASEPQLLTLNGLTGGQTYTLTFDLYALDSWDGDAKSNGPDVFQVSADGALLMRDSISNASINNPQSFNSSAGIRLQVVPTLSGTEQRPGNEFGFTLVGSGFMEGASTVSIGGVALVDTDTTQQHLDVSGAANSRYFVVAPLTLDGKIRVVTEGGFAEIAAPTLPEPTLSSFTGIAAPALLSGTPAGGVAVNAGQTITLRGQGFTSGTLVQFQGMDDAGQAGVITRGGTVSGNGTAFAVQVPVLARSGAVRVLGAAESHSISIVPHLRSWGGTVAAGNTVILEGTGLVPAELSVLVDGQAVAGATVRTIFDSGTYGSNVQQETGVQQLLTLQVPAGVGAGVITVTTAGGTTTLRHLASTRLADLTPADDVGDTMAASTQVTLAIGEEVVVAAEVGDGTHQDGDVDLYRINLAADDRLRLNLSGSTYTYLRVFDDTGAEQAADYVSPNNTQPTLFRAATTGTYYVGVSGYTNTLYDPTTDGSGQDSFYTGTYALGLARTSNGSTALTALTASADRGTAAQGGVASANPGQTITLLGQGLAAGERVVFTILNGSSYLSTQTVTPASVAADGTSLTVVVPDTAATGTVRLARDTAGLLLQVVPVLLDVAASVNGAFIGGGVALTGLGFIEGGHTINFGAASLVDTSRSRGSSVSGAIIGGKFIQNSSIQGSVPSDADTGPISVTTVGGTSNVFDISFTGITGLAASGTPADALKPSANAGQSITLQGTKFDIGMEVVFETFNGASQERRQMVVRPASVSDDATTASVLVPDTAVTGFVRVFGDMAATEAFLQIVPVVTGADIVSVRSDGASATVRLKGGGFIDGNGSSYLFGTMLVEDAGPGTGPNAYSGAPEYRENGTVDLTLLLGDASFGPIVARTEGGTSTPFSVALTSITAAASSGTAAEPLQASANPGDTITLNGTGLTLATDVLLRYRESGNGALRMTRLSPATVADDGTSATLAVPANANGAFTLQVLGSSSQPLLQIVPVVNGYDVSSSSLYIYGGGFLEGGSTIGFAGATVVDSSTDGNIDIFFSAGGDNTGLRLIEPVHGFGPLTVSTAGGTSAAFVLNEMTLPYGYLRGVAFDTASAALWVADNGGPGKLYRIDSANGAELQAIVVNTTDFGSTSFYGGMQFVTEAFSLNGTNVPVGSLLVFNGQSNADRVIALNAATGAAIASLTLGANYDLTSGVFDPVTNHLFVFDRRAATDLIVEIDPADGSQLSSFAAPANAGESGMAIDPVTGNLWYGTDGGRIVYEVTTAGVAVRSVDLTAQGINQNEITGLAFDAGGSLLVSSSQGRVYRVTV